MNLTWHMFDGLHALYADGVYTNFAIVGSPSSDGDDYAWLFVEAEGFTGPARIMSSRTWPTYESAQTYVEAYYRDNYMELER